MMPQMQNIFAQRMQMPGQMQPPNMPQQFQMPTAGPAPAPIGGGFGTMPPMMPHPVGGPMPAPGFGMQPVGGPRPSPIGMEGMMPQGGPMQAPQNFLRQRMMGY